MTKKVRKWIKIAGSVSILVVLGWSYFQFQPMPVADKLKIQFGNSATVASTLKTLEAKKVIRNARAARIYSAVTGLRAPIRAGTYEFRPGMTLREVFQSLRNPIQRMVRIPEGRWIARIAEHLEKRDVVPASDYIQATQDIAGLGLPQPWNELKSLEGFLYPDTYNFPEGTKASDIVKRQLLNFRTKTEKLAVAPDEWPRILTIASLLELEASDFQERKLISGVIQNRLKRKMRLQIDATVNYGMQLWRPLYYRDYTQVKSPFNTYLISGLPPGPICSPTLPSIEAAIQPAQHDYLFYITMPDGVTRFSETYPEHLKWIAKRDDMKRQYSKSQKSKPLLPNEKVEAK